MSFIKVVLRYILRSASEKKRGYFAVKQHSALAELFYKLCGLELIN